MAGPRAGPGPADGIRPGDGLVAGIVGPSAAARLRERLPGARSSPMAAGRARDHGVGLAHAGRWRIRDRVVRRPKRSAAPGPRPVRNGAAVLRDAGNITAVRLPPAGPARHRPDRRRAFRSGARRVPHLLLRARPAPPLTGGGLSGRGSAGFLPFCFVPGRATLDAGVVRVPPGSRLSFDPARGGLTLERWYRLSYSGALLVDEGEIRLAFRERLERATARRMESGVDPGVLLSGGMDSSAVVTLARRAHAGALYTYSFRCEGPTLDESYYARALAKELGSRHTEVPYGEAEARRQRELVAEADVPFCNVGINVGTWLLGQAARAETSYVLTGDGGDELWGSHPVYAVQRLARSAEWLPVPRVTAPEL